MHLQVFSRTKEPALLTAPVGKGGEATAYALNDRADALVKVYHDMCCVSGERCYRERFGGILPTNIWR